MPTADLTRPVRPGMPAYPGTPDVRFRRIADYEPDGYRERELTLVSHTGTHVDAPAHMIPGGATLDAFSANHFSGPAAVLDATAAPPGGGIGVDALTDLGDLEGVSYLLVHTGFAAKWGTPEYLEDIPVFTEPAAERLAGLAESNGGRLRGVGLDLVSVDPVGAAAFPVHHILLGAGLVLVENLADLSPLPPAGAEFFCPPLLLDQADGAPCRAWARW